LGILIDYNASKKVIYLASSQLTNKITLDLIHQRINYLNKELLIKTINNTLKLSNKLKTLKLSYNNPCFISKFHKKVNKTPISHEPNLIVFDINIIRLFKLLRLKGEAYFLTITN